MPISIDWATKVIFVPKSELTLVSLTPIEIYELDLNVFRLALKQIESTQQGITHLSTHNYAQPLDIGTIQLGRAVKIINGYTITFEDDIYAVEIVNGNSNLNDVVNINSVSVRTNNAAGLVYSRQLENQSFVNGRVYINIDRGLTGTNFPLGTITSPVNNYKDSYNISLERNLRSFDIIGDLTFSNNAIISDTDWYSNGFSKLTFTGNNINNSSFNNLILTGSFTGSIFVDCCKIVNIDLLSGTIKNSSLTGTINLSNSNSNIIFKDCYSGDSDYTVIDCQNLNSNLLMLGYNGDLKIINLNSNVNVFIETYSGNIILDSSNTNGSVQIKGISKVKNSASPNCTVTVNALTIGNINQLIQQSSKAADMSEQANFKI